LPMEYSRPKWTFIIMFVKNSTGASEGVTRDAIDLEVHRRELASALPEF
jgi:hypothetical protein